MRILHVFLLSLVTSTAPAATGTPQSVHSAFLGAVELVTHAGNPKGLVILFADAPSQRRDSLAVALADLDYVVARVSPGHAFANLSDGKRGNCIDVAAAVQSLTDQVTASAGGLAAGPPVVVGAGDGAVLAYLAAAQARPRQLHAAVSVDFHARLPAGFSPCRLHGQMTRPGSMPPAILEAARHLNAPWFVFQPEDAQKQGGDPTQDFISRVPDAQLTLIKGASTPPYRGAELPEFLALMQWLDPRIAQQVTGTAALTGLPLTEVPAQVPGDDRLVVMLSGDGGWAALDRGVSAAFAAQGIGTVGLDSLRYFWQKRTPEETAAAVAGIIDWYTKHWNKRRVILFGYSFGADVLPFVVNRLPMPVRERIDRVVFAGLGHRAAFEFHLSNWLSDAPEQGPSVVDEVRRMPEVRIICIYGSDEGPASACPDLNPAVVLHELPGDHHFNEDYTRVAEAALDPKSAP